MGSRSGRRDNVKVGTRESGDSEEFTEKKKDLVRGKRERGKGTIKDY